MPPGRIGLPGHLGGGDDQVDEEVRRGTRSRAAGRTRVPPTTGGSGSSTVTASGHDHAADQVRPRPGAPEQDPDQHQPDQQRQLVAQPVGGGRGVGRAVTARPPARRRRRRCRASARAGRRAARSATPYSGPASTVRPTVTTTMAAVAPTMTRGSGRSGRDRCRRLPAAAEVVGRRRRVGGDRRVPRPGRLAGGPVRGVRRPVARPSPAAACRPGPAAAAAARGVVGRGLRRRPPERPAPHPGDRHQRQQAGDDAAGDQDDRPASRRRPRPASQQAELADEPGEAAGCRRGSSPARSTGSPAAARPWPARRAGRPRSTRPGARSGPRRGTASSGWRCGGRRRRSRRPARPPSPGRCRTPCSRCG